VFSTIGIASETMREFNLSKVFRDSPGLTSAESSIFLEELIKLAFCFRVKNDNLDDL
jgi:hypothetical protein